MSCAYAFLGEASFFDGVTVEDPSSLAQLQLEVSSATDPVNSGRPTTPRPGLFDSMAIHIPDETNPADDTSTTTPAFDAPRMSNERGQSGFYQDYTGILIVLVIIVGLLLAVGLLQFWMLRKIAIGSHLKRATDLEQGYQVGKGAGAETHSEAVIGQ
ncbi:hypothetical protein FOL47_006291 [Perkinsus chesapeaki]|uniref:Uncharacterized protein n=1 Tax=Perkinsus chesapeaki TaxID=330153 RepID=A0A7J6MYG5_PERCH|nr:hypothetical protein FOL47_006291 [Perkinsus chesapeaki]